MTMRLREGGMLVTKDRDGQTIEKIPYINLPSSREDAVAAGSNYYFTGLPCKDGHSEPRWASTKKCMECSLLRTKINSSKPEAKKRANEKKRNRMRADPELRRRKNEKTAKAKAERIANDPSFRGTLSKRALKIYYRVRDDPVLKERARRRAQKWYRDNPDKARAAAEKRYVVAYDKIAANNRNRRARKCGAEGRHTASDIKKILEAQQSVCVYCTADISEKRHIDHIVPLSRGGSNWPHNIQILCPTCNLSKSDKTHDEFLEYLSWLKENIPVQASGANAMQSHAP